MKIIKWDALSGSEQNAVLKRPVARDYRKLQIQTEKIVGEVRERGDDALREFTKLYDGVSLQDIRVGKNEWDKAIKSVSASAKTAMKIAVKHIYSFHKAQYPKSISVKTGYGIVCEKRPRPIQKVGLYIPGGTAVLPSTVLMLGIPAKIAGCVTKIISSPPQKDGNVDANILYAAKLCGIKDVYKIGGAQAIAAMAYGTSSVPKVDKIFGPGNSFVTQAKILVAGDPEGASYDMPAGPSEVMVIADKYANSAFVAADLLSQAEHGVDSQVFLVSDDINIAKQVLEQMDVQIKALPKENIARKSLENSSILVVGNLETAFVISNRYAPEHLILQINSARKWVDKVKSAGSVFIGQWSPESVGDYASGTNHVLPTYGYARTYSGLTVSDFMTQITFQELTKEGLRRISDTVIKLAEIEGLDAHKRACSIRLD